MTAAVGATFGVEEEYHVVDAETFALRDSPELNARAGAGALGARIHAEIATTQLEIATGICRTTDELRAELTAARREATAAAAAVGATVLIASTHPSASWTEQRLTLQPRYITLLERWGVLALQQVICGCHVHVSVPDLDTAVQVMDHARPYLPLLLALTGSSPFHECVDTGYDSFRTQWFARWPIAGPSEPLGDADTYRGVIDDLTRAGVIDDPSHLYWDIRPSLRHPTLEFRVGDVCTSLDDAVLHAALVRALAATLAERAASGVRPVPIRAELLRAARWRAARYGLSDRLLDPATGELVEPRLAISRLLVELEPQLADRGEVDEARALVQQVFDRGTSAARQREVLQRTGDPAAVAAYVVRAGLRGCDETTATTPTGTAGG